MKFTKNIGMLLLAILLILWGLSAALPRFGVPMNLLGYLAIATGVFILIGK